MKERKIEYLGYNYWGGKLLNEKLYYYWEGGTVPQLEGIANLIQPFDYSIRKSGYSKSISAFISSPHKENIDKVVNYATKKLEIPINKRLFFSSFLNVADFESGSHYSPIVSFKYGKTKIEAISFYVSALREKEKMFDYLERAIYNVDLNSSLETKSFITNTIQTKSSDLFLVSWDYSLEGDWQNKLYVKIKHFDDFKKELYLYQPSLIDYIYVNGYRINALAFAIKDGRLSMFNLYYKPL